MLFNNLFRKRNKKIIFKISNFIFLKNYNKKIVKPKNTFVSKIWNKKYYKNNNFILFWNFLNHFYFHTSKIYYLTILKQQPLHTFQLQYFLKMTSNLCYVPTLINFKLNWNYYISKHFLIISSNISIFFAKNFRINIGSNTITNTKKFWCYSILYPRLLFPCFCHQVKIHRKIWSKLF